MDRQQLEKFAYGKDDLKLITTKKKKGLRKIAEFLKIYRRKLGEDQ